jgi:hypothetical protein
MNDGAPQAVALLSTRPCTGRRKHTGKVFIAEFGNEYPESGSGAGQLEDCTAVRAYHHRVAESSRRYVIPDHGLPVTEVRSIKRQRGIAVCDAANIVENK